MLKKGVEAKILPIFTKNYAMRDFIWTVIIIWVVFKIFNLIKGVTVKKTVIFNNYQGQNSTSKKPEGSVTVEANSKQTSKSPKQDLNDGEYVDYEEIK